MLTYQTVFSDTNKTTTTTTATHSTSKANTCQLAALTNKIAQPAANFRPLHQKSWQATSVAAFPCRVTPRLSLAGVRTAFAPYSMTYRVDASAPEYRIPESLHCTHLPLASNRQMNEWSAQSVVRSSIAFSLNCSLSLSLSIFCACCLHQVYNSTRPFKPQQRLQSKRQQ